MDLSNISILNLMPPNLAEDKNIKMAAEAFDEVLRDIIKQIPDVSVIPNLVLNKTVDAVLIDLLAWQFHVDFYDPKMPIETKRYLVMKSLDWHFRKGTPSVVEDIVSTFFSKAIVQEWFEYGGLPYRFQVATEESMPDPETRSNLIRAINSVKNTRSFFETLMQLVYFVDEIVMNELQKMELRKQTPVDDFSSSGRLRRNGRFRRDGTFVNTELKEYFVDRYEKYKRDGGLIHGENYRRVPSRDTISPPFLRNTWERERFFITFDYGRSARSVFPCSSSPRYCSATRRFSDPDCIIRSRSSIYCRCRSISSRCSATREAFSQPLITAGRPEVQPIK